MNLLSQFTSKYYTFPTRFFIMRLIIQCFIILSLLTYNFSAVQGRCAVSVKEDLPPKVPLILNPNGPGFQYPDNSGILHYSKGDQVRLVCNGRNNGFLNLDRTPPASDIIAECVQDDLFKVLGKKEKFQDLGCRYSPSDEQRTIGSCHPGSYVKYEIGFSFGDEFEKLIEVCHDPVKVLTAYSRYELVKEIGVTTGRPRLSFKVNDDHDIDYEAQYNRNVQIDTVGRILGSDTKGMEYIKKTGNSYLARGHLAPNADFLYDFQRRATFYYINQEPQWQRCNAQGWAYLESAIRKYANFLEKDLIVFTGVHGTDGLPDINNIYRELFLYFPNKGSKHAAIPVPRFFWKVIYDQHSQKAIAFVQVNTCCSNTLNPEDQLCDNPITSERWAGIQTYDCPTYACEVDELREKITIIPDFRVKGILV